MFRFVSFSADSTMLLSCSGESLRVWTAQSSKQCVRHIDNTGYSRASRTKFGSMMMLLLLLISSMWSLVCW